MARVQQWVRLRRLPGGGCLAFVQDVRQVYSTEPVPDMTWRHVDQQGHEHAWDQEYANWPLLVWVADSDEPCPKCGEHEQGHFECRLCHDGVTPELTSDCVPRLVVTAQRYYLNGVLIATHQARMLTSLLSNYHTRGTG